MPSSDIDDDDAIFAQLQDEIDNDDSAALREQGRELLKRQRDKANELQAVQHGHYSEITGEKEVMDVCAQEQRCVVHFYHPDFKRCEIMDTHLAALASKYRSTRFFRVFVQNVPWLVQRLTIQILPCVLCFINGVSKDRLTGFEELGNVDVFPTAVLELRLSSSGVIGAPGNPSQSSGSKTRRHEDDDNEDTDVFDLDE